MFERELVRYAPDDGAVTVTIERIACDAVQSIGGGAPEVMLEEVAKRMR